MIAFSGVSATPMMSTSTALLHLLLAFPRHVKRACARRELPVPGFTFFEPVARVIHPDPEWYVWSQTVTLE